MSTPASGAPPIRVLVVEDSAFMRGVIGQLLHSDPEIRVVGQVADGLQAVEAVTALAPDVVTMDVHMPRGDGLAAVARIMSERPTPILMLSAATHDGSMAAIRALELGAVDFLAKPSGRVDPGLDRLRDTLIQKVRMAARVRPVRTVVASGNGAAGAAAALPGLDPLPAGAPVPCVVVAASTGGPAALLGIVPALPRALPAAVLVVQHLPAPYTAQLARELAGRSAVAVKEAVDGDALRPGTVYVAPGSRDVVVARYGLLGLRAGERDDGACPSANLAMASAARYAGPATLGIVLTGMGADGALGVEAIARAGGRVIAQDEPSSVVYGMPRAAVATGCVNVVVPLAKVVETVLGCLRDPAACRGRVGHAA